MKKIKTRAEVLQWFREKGVLHTIERRLPFSLDRHLPNVRHLEDFLITAFDWKYSSEGYAYWNNLNREYTDWYNNTNTEK